MATYRAYPYPVLGNEDDIVEGFFNFSMERTLEIDAVTIDCKFHIEHETIESLITEKKAQFIVEVICSATFYRKAFSSETFSFYETINASDLRGKVTVESYICASENIKNYDPVDTHPDLMGYTADVRKGEILAVGGTATFSAEKEFDPLKAPVSSFMKIQAQDARKAPINVDYGTDKIIIQLAKEDYESYLQIKDSAAANLHSSVVFPVLVDALYLLNTDSRNYENLQWFSRLEQICNEKGFDIQSPFETAQKILQKPVSRGFRNTKELLDLE